MIYFKYTISFYTFFNQKFKLEFSAFKFSVVSLDVSSFSISFIAIGFGWIIATSFFGTGIRSFGGTGITLWQPFGVISTHVFKISLCSCL